MDKQKTTYLRAIILKNDISIYHQALEDEKDWNKKIRLLKDCFIALSLFKDSCSHFSKFVKNNKDLVVKIRSLKKRLPFIKHLRNKISGHLDEKLLEKAVEWEPMIFSKKIKDNEYGKLFLIYKTLLESGINSFVDKDFKQKVFNKEIDITYPPDQTLFFNFIGTLNLETIDFLTELIKLLDKSNEYWKDDQMIEMVQKASKTSFDLNKK